MLSCQKLLLLLTALSLSTLSEAAQDNKEETKTTSTPPRDQQASNMFVDFSKLEALDWLRSGAILVGFIFAFLGDKKGETRVWQLAESIFLGLYGLGAFFFPSLILDYFTVGKLDNLHVFQFQFFGFMLLSLAMVSHLQYRADSKDLQVTGGWLLSRVVGLSFFMVEGVYVKVSMAKDSVRLSEQVMAVSGLGFTLLWVGSMVKLWQHYSSENGGGRSASRGKSDSVLNKYLLVAILFNLPGVVMDFGMPSLIMKFFAVPNHDNFHLHLIRAMGALGLTYILQEMTALHYDNDEDKRKFFIGHVVGMPFVIPLLILNQLKYQLFSTWGFCACLGGMPLLLGICMRALYVSRKDKKY